ncbi:MAG: class I SAM-dependent methyltransferase [Bacteroidota bacterium]
MKWKFANNTSQQSMAHQFRFKRFLFFRSLLERLPRPVSILDIGGTQDYWNMMGFSDSSVKITLLNLEVQPVSGDSFVSVKGNATDLSGYADQSFDIVYSNSVIEHLFTRKAQEKMANEVSRVGKYYFVQTPNYYFPIEPHWVFPFFQFLPIRSRLWLTRHFNLGHIGRITDRIAAEKQVREIQLLTGDEMQNLFPDASLYHEKILLFTKSIVAYRFP